MHKVIVDDEQEVLVCILGDLVYPLLPYLMEEFVKGGNNPQEQFFGYCFSSAQMVVEYAIGCLKARFGIHRRSMDLSMSNILKTIHACFILYNFCEMNDESNLNDPTKADALYDQQFHQRSEAIAEVRNNEKRGKGIEKFFHEIF